MVANVVDERPVGEGGERTVRGTTHFRPNTKLYVFALYAGMCDAVVVVGRHRGSNRYVRMTLKAHYLVRFRPKVVYSPRVLTLMDVSIPGCVVITDEENANSWAEALPLWGPPHYGRLPDG